jgi:7,8-dihydropterin-6-yl-methyl-4-(beta-D-ribofuranosyl)aminobenzene 5'-phosphate synthase
LALVHGRGFLSAMIALLRVCALYSLMAAAAFAAQAKAVKITVLSTMLADGQELGEWGFAALVEVDGRRILFDTGAHTDVVLKNARTLKIDLANVPDVILSHFHEDHTTGFIPLRQSVMTKSPEALARTHVGEGIFASYREGPPQIERNAMVRWKPEYEATGGRFIVHAKPAELFPGVWVTGYVPRKSAEQNWSGKSSPKPAGNFPPVNIPDDLSLVIDTADGLVIVTGCGHAGIVNIVDHARDFVRPARIHALIGGIHLFNASEATLAWTTDKLRAVGLDHFIGAHCTGIETVYRFRRDLGLDRAHCVVSAVGGSFELGRGIDPRTIAK